MADFLTIAGSPVRAVEGTAVAHARLYAGGRQRMYDLSIVSTQDPTTEKRVFDTEVDLYSPTEESTLRSAAPVGDAVTVAGDWIGASIQAVVDIGDAKPWQTWDADGYLIYKTVTLHIEEA